MRAGRRSSPDVLSAACLPPAFSSTEDAWDLVRPGAPPLPPSALFRLRGWASIVTPLGLGLRHRCAPTSSVARSGPACSRLYGDVAPSGVRRHCGAGALACQSPSLCPLRLRTSTATPVLCHPPLARRICSKLDGGRASLGQCNLGDPAASSHHWPHRHGARRGGLSCIIQRHPRFGGAEMWDGPRFTTALSLRDSGDSRFHRHGAPRWLLLHRSPASSVTRAGSLIALTSRLRARRSPNSVRSRGLRRCACVSIAGGGFPAARRVRHRHGRRAEHRPHTQGRRWSRRRGDLGGSRRRSIVRPHIRAGLGRNQPSSGRIRPISV